MFSHFGGCEMHQLNITQLRSMLSLKTCLCLYFPPMLLQASNMVSGVFCNYVLDMSLR